MPVNHNGAITMTQLHLTATTNHHACCSVIAHTWKYFLCIQTVIMNKCFVLYCYRVLSGLRAIYQNGNYIELPEKWLQEISIEKKWPWAGFEPLAFGSKGCGFESCTRL